LSLAISPNYSIDSTVFAGTYSGVYKSTDGGTNWTQVNSGLANTNIKSLAISPDYSTDSTIFAGTIQSGTSGGAYKSNNGGISWTQVNLPNVSIESLAISPNYSIDSTVFAGPNTGVYSGVFKSTNGGISWTQINNGFTSTFTCSLAISPDYSTDSTIFAGTDYSGALKSIDGGTSWTQINSGLTNTNVRSLAISPDYSTDSTLFAGTEGGVFSYISSTDTIPPNSFDLNLPANGATINKPYPYFSWNPSSDSDSGLAKYQLYIDGSLARDNIVDWTAAVPVSVLSNGSHNWFVRAWDNAGNYRDSTTRDIIIDVGEGRIAFVSDRDGNDEIYAMNADGTNQTRLTSNTDPDEAPSWSPDGSKIAYVSGSAYNSEEIFVMNYDGSGQTRLTNNSISDRHPDWSPDGTRITFASNRDGNFEIYIMNADGTNLTRLTNNDSLDWRPTWFPDGSKIAFVSERNGGEDILIMNSDGSNQQLLVDGVAEDHWPSWSPDGSKIAFESTRDGDIEIYIIGVDGTSQTRLTNSPGIDDAPSWSLDGSSLAFQSGRDGNMEIYTMSANGASQENHTNNSSTDVQPNWGPGSLIADTTPPTTPTLSGSASSSTQINLSWTASTDNVGVSGYQVYNADTNALLATTTSTSRSFTGLTPNTTYRYYVKAYDAANNYSDASNTVAITTPSAPPGGPTGIVAKVGDMKNTLSWNPVSNATYNVYRSTSATGMYFRITSSPIQNTSYTDEPGTKGIYYYKVSSIVGGAESSLSAAIEANFVDMTKLVSTSGGTLDALNGAVKTEVQSNALSESKDIAVVQISSPAPAPAGLSFVSNAYDFGPSGTSFDSEHPVTITLRYDGTLVDPNTIDVYWYDGSSWKRITDGRTVNTSNNTISVETTHFTPFVVMSSGYGVSTGCNTNIIILSAISAIAGGILLIGKLKFVMI